MEDNKKVLEWLDQNKMELAKFLSDMVRIQSVNEGTIDTCDERDMAEFVAEEYKKMKLEVETLSFDKDGKRANVVGIYKGTGEGRNILFNSHMDVVPADHVDEWQYPPFEGLIAEDKVHGRGAIDDKFGIAAFTYAVKALQANGIKLKGDVILLPSAGEESGEGGTYGLGPAVKTLLDRGMKIDGAVVGELSDFDIQIQSNSTMFFEVVVKGKSCHSGWRNQCMFPQPWGIPSGSEVGVDALEHLLPIIEMFYRKEKDWNLNTMKSSVMGTGDGMGVGAFAINPCSFSGGGYLGSVPAEARITYGLWFDNSISDEEMIKEIKDSVAAVSSTDSWLRENPPEVNVPIIQDWPGYSTDRNCDFVKAVEECTTNVLGRPAVVSGFKAACDASWINKYGIPSITLGCGGQDNHAHTLDEYVGIEELLKITKVYAEIMMKWCE